MKLLDASKLVLVAMIYLLRQMMLSLGNVVQPELLHHGKSEVMTVEDTILAMPDLPDHQETLHHGQTRTVEMTTVAEITMVEDKTKMVAIMELHLETLLLGNNSKMLLQHIQAGVTLLLVTVLAIHLSRPWAPRLALLPD